MGSQKLVGIVLIALGILLLYFGYQSSQSLGEQLTETFTGRFTDETMYFIIGGAISLVAGVFMAFLRK
ncbi:MAG: hypothetical protein CVV07_11815 [Gammaproteobacteria bacterium HGW-Gammaproteobacteria-11]|nr:MAG: hypothetical protein CVV07_11815 [Gammaproteobacteria bacterium HGW-Gammaproteobacteria-11]